MERRKCKRWSDVLMGKALLIFFFAGSAAYAIGAPASESPGWGVEHWDLARVLIAGLFGIVAFFLIRVLNRFDKSQDLLFHKHDLLAEQISETAKLLAKLQGRCEAINCQPED